MGAQLEILQPDELQLDFDDILGEGIITKTLDGGKFQRAIQSYIAQKVAAERVRSSASWDKSNDALYSQQLRKEIYRECKKLLMLGSNDHTHIKADEDLATAWVLIRKNEPIQAVRSQYGEKVADLIEDYKKIKNFDFPNVPDDLDNLTDHEIHFLERYHTMAVLLPRLPIALHLAAFDFSVSLFALNPAKKDKKKWQFRAEHIWHPVLTIAGFHQCASYIADGIFRYCDYPNYVNTCKELAINAVQDRKVLLAARRRVQELLDANGFDRSTYTLKARTKGVLAAFRTARSKNKPVREIPDKYGIEWVSDADAFAPPDAPEYDKLRAAKKQIYRTDTVIALAIGRGSKKMAYVDEYKKLKESELARLYREELQRNAQSRELPPPPNPKPSPTKNLRKNEEFQQTESSLTRRKRALHEKPIPDFEERDDFSKYYFKEFPPLEVFRNYTWVRNAIHNARRKDYLKKPKFHQSNEGRDPNDIGHQALHDIIFVEVEVETEDEQDTRPGKHPTKKSEKNQKKVLRKIEIKYTDTIRRYYSEYGSKGSARVNYKQRRLLLSQSTLTKRTPTKPDGQITEFNPLKIHDAWRTSRRGATGRSDKESGYTGIRIQGPYNINFLDVPNSQATVKDFIVATYGEEALPYCYGVSYVRYIDPDRRDLPHDTENGKADLKAKLLHGCQVGKPLFAKPYRGEPNPAFYWSFKNSLQEKSQPRA